jgi:hypothetical protein
MMRSSWPTKSTIFHFPFLCFQEREECECLYQICVCFFWRWNEVTKSRCYSTDDEPFVGVEMGFAETCLVHPRRNRQTPVDSIVMAARKYCLFPHCDDMKGKIGTLIAKGQATIDFRKQKNSKFFICSCLWTACGQGFIYIC